jgi:acyl-CoA synthetase (AMP-forming)/AMP-acid ligase II/3-oxoacyl-(acyl-carrier-protein) synthase/acyl carrier protein
MRSDFRHTKAWPVSVLLEPGEVKGPAFDGPKCETPAARLAASLFAAADAATLVVANRLLPALREAPPPDAGALIALVARTFDIPEPEPQGVMAIALTLMMHDLAARDAGCLRLTSAGRVMAGAAAKLDLLTAALRRGGEPGLVTPDRLWAGLTVDPPSPVRAPSGPRPGRRALLARCLAREPEALEALGGLPGEAQEAWLEHVSASALCVAERIGLIGQLIEGGRREQLQSAVALPMRHGWASRGREPTRAGLFALLTSLEEAEIAQRSAETWHLRDELRPALGGASPLRGVIAALRHEGLITPERLLRALDARKRHADADPMTVSLRVDPGAFHHSMHGLSWVHAGFLRGSPRISDWLAARGVNTLVSLGCGSGVLPLSLCDLPGEAGPRFERAFFLDLVPDTSQSYAALYHPRPQGQERRFIKLDFFRDAVQKAVGELPSGALIELGNVLHDWTPDQNIEILRNLAGALTMGERYHLAVTERFFADDLASSSLGALRFHQLMQVWTRGQQYRLTDLRAWLAAAGLSVEAIEVVPGDDDFQTALVKVQRTSDVASTRMEALERDERSQVDETIVSVLRRRASAQPDALVYTHLVDGENDEVHLTFGELWQRAVAVADALRAQGLAGERALLLFPPGLDYAPALFGCFLAGVVAVPEGPPDPRRPERSLPRIQAVAASAQAAAVLTTEKLLGVRAHLPAALAGVPWLAIDSIRAAGDVRLELDSALAVADDLPAPHAVAYLQYTSGSTADPKGVMLSHRHLAANCRAIEEIYRLSRESVMVSWVPTFHDLGLVYGISMPVWSGFRGVSLAAADFAQRPSRWLRAIHRYRGTHSIAPDTAYAITALRARPVEQEGLDLSSWQVALNGAEPVRATTERAFIEAFGPHGFRAEAFSHSWGLSEATAMVTGERVGSRMQFLRVDADALARHEVRYASADVQRTLELASCGETASGTTLCIVDPASRRPLPPDRVGEVWVRGPSVGLGYFEAPASTADIFGARTEGGEGPWLRTGDRGFLHEGRLFIAGRIKEVLIVRGANHYPQDLEASILGAHPALRPGGTAAFSVDSPAGEQVVIVSEVRPDQVGQAGQTSGPEPIYGAIRAALANHGLRPSTIALVSPNALPRTTSGKLQRRKAQQLLLDGALPVLHRWDQETATEAALGAASESASPRTAELEGRAFDALSSLTRTIREHAARVLGLKLAEVPSDRPLTELGFDSAAFSWLAAGIEDALGRPVSAVLFFDHPSPSQSARYLLAEGLPEKARDAVPAREERSVNVDPIVIVSMACRLPGGANTPEDLWALLDEGRDAIVPFPEDRGWDIEALFDPDPDAVGHSYTTQGGFVDGISLFDPALFHISPREACAMDPQQRMLLELAWEAIERAGLNPSSLQDSDTGVFVGLMYADYEQHVPSARTAADGHPAIGFQRSVASGRIAYTLGLLGPAITIDTACSSSLVALHQAIVSLERGECTLALAGGATLFTTPDMFIWFSRMRGLAPDGRTKAFSAGADGAGWSEGAGLVMLTRQSEARRRGLPVLAVIRGSAVNQDGRTQGLTAPNGPSQQRVIRAALAAAGLEAKDIDAVEAHGTGTALGDPIEAGALLVTYGQRPADRPLKLGAIKSNIGHTQAAAGIAGLMKMMLALQHERLPKTLHITSPSPHVDWTRGAIELLTDAADWRRGARPRRAGISSFGISGTNAHVIIEEAPAEPAAPAENDADPKALPLLLSGQSEAALRAQARRLLEHLTAHPELRAVDVAATLALRRAALPVRLATRFGDLEALRRFADGGPAPGAMSRAGHPADPPPPRGEPAKQEERVAALCREWAAGGEVDWSAFFAPYRPRPVSLPTYAFQRRRYWMDAPRGDDERQGQRESKDTLMPTQSSGVLPPDKDHHVAMKQPSSPPSMSHELLELIHDIREQIRSGATEVDIRIDEMKGFQFRLAPAAGRAAEKTGPQPIARPSGDNAQGVVSSSPSSSTPPPARDGKRRLMPLAALSEKPVLQAKGDEPQDPRPLMKKMLANTLGIDNASEIDERAKFLDLGVDSVVGVQFVQEINRAFRLRLKAGVLYDYPTLAELGAYVAAQTGSHDARRGAIGARTEPALNGALAGASPGEPSAQRGELREILARVAKGALEPQEGNRQIELLKARARTVERPSPSPSRALEPPAAESSRRDAEPATAAVDSDEKRRVFSLIKGCVIEIVPELSEKTVQHSDSFEALGLDSMDQAEVVTRALAELALNVPRIHFAKVKTLGDLADRLTSTIEQADTVKTHER